MDENPYRAPREPGEQGGHPRLKIGRLVKAVSLAVVLTFDCLFVLIVGGGIVAALLHPDAVRSGTRLEG